MISIILPLFNAEKYIAAAIGSVRAQTYSDWELIIVDDGSTDSSPVICREAAQADPRIKTVTISNHGVSYARNQGLEMAKGEYLMFLDADDLLTPDSLIDMLEATLNLGSDIVCGRIMEFTGNPPALPSLSGKEKEDPVVYTPEDAVADVLYKIRLDNSPCGKLYSAEVWKDVRFRENTRYEDLDIFYEVYFKASSISWIPETVYLYRQHSQSYMHKFDAGRLDVLDVASRLTRHMLTFHTSLLPAARSRELSANFNILSLIAVNRRSKGPEPFIYEASSQRCWNKIKELRAEALRNPNVSVKNKAAIILSYAGGRKLIEAIAPLFYK